MKMKKISKVIALVLASAMLMSGCGKTEPAATTPEVTETPSIIIDDTTSTVTEAPTPVEEEPEEEVLPEEEAPEGCVRSQLTNEWIDEELADARPLAVMVPNNKSALPQYEISNCGVIYECLAEGGISRLLCIWDDWRDMDRIGNVRSARAYYVYWALEWDPIFCHYGNVLYADPILGADACDNINGTKSPYGYYRVTNEGRISEQTAYTSTEDVKKACDYYGYSLTHTQYYKEGHWTFTSALYPNDLTQYDYSVDCTYIDCSGAFTDDKPYFEYNADEGVYYRYEFGSAHMDAAHDVQLSFKNVLIQFCDKTVLDEYDHLEYAINSSGTGYYITNGKAIAVSWKKTGDLNPTKFYDAEGNELVLNTGKTFVCVVSTGKEVTLQ